MRRQSLNEHYDFSVDHVAYRLSLGRPLRALGLPTISKEALSEADMPSRVDHTCRGCIYKPVLILCICGQQLLPQEYRVLNILE